MGLTVETDVYVCCCCREVSVEEGQMLASNWECPFVECSAKDNENISTWSLRTCALSFFDGSCNDMSMCRRGIYLSNQGD